MIGVEMKNRLGLHNEKTWKEIANLKSIVCLFVVMVFFCMVSCTSVSNEPFLINQIAENQSFNVPYISIENNQLCLRDALLHETLALQSLPTKNAAVTKPIFRQDAMYFSIWDQDEGSSWSGVWKYQLDTGEVGLIWENTKENCKLLNIDPTDSIFCMQTIDTEKPVLFFVNITSSTTKIVVLDENRMMDLCYFSQDSNSVILGQSIEEEASDHYLFFTWSLDSSERIYEIGRGMQPLMNEDGTIFFYRTQNPPSLVFYSLESRERISFRQQTNTIQWDFWKDDTFFLAEKYSIDDTFPRFYRLNMRGEKEELSLPEPQEESEVWYVGMEQKCPVVYVQSATMNGFMKYADNGEWQRYAPLVDYTVEKPATYVSEFVPIFEQHHSPYTLSCLTGSYSAFFVETLEDEFSEEDQDSKSYQVKLFSISKEVASIDDKDMRIVSSELEGFHHLSEESKFSLSAYEHGTLFNVCYYAKQESNENQPILISLSIGNALWESEDILLFTSLLHTEVEIPVLHSVSSDPSLNYAYGQVDFVDSYGDPISLQTQDILLPLQNKESIAWEDLFLLSEENIQFVSWVFPTNDSSLLLFRWLHNN